MTRLGAASAREERERRERLAAIAALHADVGAIAAARQPGVLLSLDVTHGSRRRLEAEGASSEDVARMIAAARELAERALPGAPWARLGWTRHEFSVRGTREELAPLAARLAADLGGGARTSRLTWLVVLTAIFPGEPERTLRCDPGYDLARLASSCAVWVEPYAGDDWTESQRYPITTVLWQATPA